MVLSANPIRKLFGAVQFMESPLHTMEFTKMTQNSLLRKVASSALAMEAAASSAVEASAVEAVSAELA